MDWINVGKARARTLRSWSEEPLEAGERVLSGVRSHAALGGRCAVRISCPHCGADESRCPEALPACLARGIARRRLYARANGYPPPVDFELLALLARMGFAPRWSTITIATPSASTAPNPLRRSASERPRSAEVPPRRPLP